MEATLCLYPLLGPSPPPCPGSGLYRGVEGFRLRRCAVGLSAVARGGPRQVGATGDRWVVSVSSAWLRGTRSATPGHG